mmetsp:Transcript_10851/g.25880  ORF Transcript_10851/g.25880 Transcript_10851/m.25880 type:complete len:417 (-) Transcript_10851:895-2145(-)|eukprot:CAMPEP_0113460530 /NCGR_PEP_ID=MMETSP0014_2-20120614/11040_1 /TAXON_ID=2857 /ORGANISM="Nitzschia sp." /LENGTH=416 /DNA_ID=CAMNT_0000352197 /DNA_START=420 /DNA_END=1670 /DNA_ORIENTATION=- /assembly_acc=CAM_ASM_000159
MTTTTRTERITTGSPRRNRVLLLPVDHYMRSIRRNLSQLELKTLTLTHPHLRDEHIEELSETLQSSPVSDRLRKLDVHHCPEVTPRGVVALCTILEHTSVSHLSFQGVDIGPDGIVALTQLMKKTSTTADPNSLTSNDNTKSNNNDSLPLLRCRGHLKILGLDGTLVNTLKTMVKTAETEVKGLRPSHASDQQSDNAVIWNDFLATAAQSLESLDLSRNGLSSLSSSSDLKFSSSASSSHDHIRGLCDALKTDSCTLKALILSENSIGDGGFDMICNALQHNKTLVLLACAECGLKSSEQVISTSLLNCLRSNTSLRRLYLYGNDTGITLAPQQGQGKTIVEARHWLDMNNHGRSFVSTSNPAFRQEYLPFIIQKVSKKQPSLIYSLLMQTPYSMISNRRTASTASAAPETTALST